MKKRKRFSKFRWPRWLQRSIDVFYQVLLPLILFQFIRTLFLPTTLDMILLAVLVFLYLSHMMGWFAK